MADLMAMRNRILLAAPHKEMVSGNTIPLIVAEPKIELLIVNYDATQSGSGNPSPSNVRDITGVDTVSVNIGNTTASASLGATYYGGYVDLLNGTVAETRGQKVVTKWNASISTIADFTNSVRCWFYVGGFTMYQGNSITNYLTYNNDKYNADEPGFFGVMSSYPDSFWVRLPKGQGGVQDATVDGIKAYLGDHPLYIVTKLTTPATHSITPVSVSAPRGRQILTTPQTSVVLTYWTH